MNKTRVSTAPTSEIPTSEIPSTEPVSEISPVPAPSGRKNRPKKSKQPWPKLRKIGLGVLILGILVLASGAGFLFYRLTRTPGTNDAEFLVEVGEWHREDEPSVTWNFTKIGEGTLSTDDGTNEYSFAWAFDDEKLKIDTDWLYTLNDEFDFSLDQNARTFEISNDSETYKFVAD